MKEASRLLFILRHLKQDIYKRKNILMFISKFILKKSPGHCKLFKSLHGHTESINSLIQLTTGAKNISEAVLISGGKDGSIKVWKNFECERTIAAHSDSVRCICQIRWKRNNYTIISGSSDESIKIWDILSGECIHTIEDPGNTINCIRQIRTSNIKTLTNDIVLAIGGNITTVQIFYFTEINFLKVIKKLHGHSDIVLSIVNVSVQNMNTIATGSRDSTIKVWDIDKSDCILSFYVKWPVYSLLQLDTDLLKSNINDNELLFITAGMDKVVSIWDLKNSSSLGSIKGHSQSVNSVIKISVNGKKYLATSGFDKTIKLWKVKVKK